MGNINIMPWIQWWQAWLWMVGISLIYVVHASFLWKQNSLMYVFSSWKVLFPRVARNIMVMHVCAFTSYDILGLICWLEARYWQNRPRYTWVIIQQHLKGGWLIRSQVGNRDMRIVWSKWQLTCCTMCSTDFSFCFFNGRGRIAVGEDMSPIK